MNDCMTSMAFGIRIFAGFSRHCSGAPMWYRADDGLLGLRPESCWNDCLARRKSIRLCLPSHIAYEVGAARQQTVRSPRTMDPHSQEWHRNREAMVHLPA